MVTFCNIQDLEAAKEALEKLERESQTLYQKLIEMVNLTRALHFKYHYMGALLMDEDAEQYAPAFVHQSVLRLYQEQLRNLKNNDDFSALKEIFQQWKGAGYANLSRLLLGMKPETLVGASHL